MYLWEWFIQLSNTRSDSNGITYTEIKWWSELTHNPINSWEVDVIKRLDAVYLKVVKNVRH